jgi:Na+-transporting NADH:ubiquinone oxidoreductase subunit C
LGARITTSEISNRYSGKKVFDENGDLVSIIMLKGENHNPGSLDDHHIDGMSGATLTGKGVNEMLESYFGYYKNYILKTKGATGEKVALLY